MQLANVLGNMVGKNPAPFRADALLDWDQGLARPPAQLHPWLLKSSHFVVKTIELPFLLDSPPC